MNDWNIQSRAHQCQACGRSFANKETYHTLLVDDKQGYLRQDVCAACWQKQFDPAAHDRKGFISYWHGVYEAPPAAPPEAIQKESAETLLRKLMEQKNPKYAAASFILAVMLERKRILKVKEQIRSEGRRIFVYEQPKTGDIFTIPDPDLQLNQLEQVQHDVGNLLEHGLPEAAVTTPAVSVETPPDSPTRPEEATGSPDSAPPGQAATESGIAG